MTGSGYLVYVVVGGMTRGVNADGTLSPSGPGFQFSTPHDAAAALLAAVDNNPGALASFKGVQAP